MSLDTITETRIALKGADYLPRVQAIMSCLADTVGMDEAETNATSMVLTEACASTIHGNSIADGCDSVVIKLVSYNQTITADVTNPALINNSDDIQQSLGIKLMRMLSDGIQFIKHRTGLTVRFSKRTKRTTYTDINSEYLQSMLK